jgi:ribonuclease HI
MAKRMRPETLTPDEVLARYHDGPTSGVFTDGSCEGNPGPGGWGFVRVEEGEIIDQGSGKDSQTTNNRMELTAIIEAYKRMPEDLVTTVYSDSQLCVRTINVWAAGWEKRGWRR